MVAKTSCSMEYFLPKDWAKHPKMIEEDIIYVIGGLYGNLFSVETFNQMAEEEKSAPLMIFNGDMHWFDVGYDDFMAVENNTRGIKLLGNVEFELPTSPDKADCGCNYPPDVDEGTVARSNVIHSTMKKNLRGKAILEELATREKAMAISALGLTIAITHGDEKSMSGWDCARDALQKKERRNELAAWLKENRVDVLATTHTCLPAITAIENRVVSNNGSAGMANVQGKTYGLITRIAKTPHPKAVATKQVKDVYVELVKVDFPIDKFVEHFDRCWPEGSPASISYRNRIVGGTAVEEKAIDIDKGYKDKGTCC